MAIILIANASAQFYEIPQESIYGNMTSDMLIWVADYEPKIIRSDLLEENDVQVYAQLKGIQVNPFISIPVIRQVSIRPTSIVSGSLLGVSGTSYIGPRIKTPEDLGWAIIRIKRIPSEDKMPDSIDLNLSATISYDFEDAVGFGRKDLVLDIVNENDWRLNEWKYSFWDGSGYLRLADLNSKAVINLYDSSKLPISSFQLSSGEESKPYFINVNGKRGFVKVKLDGIETPEPYARAIVDVGGKKTEALLKKGSDLFAGSSWRVVDLVPSVGGGGYITIRNSLGEQETLSIETRSAVFVNSTGEEKTVTVGNALDGYYIGWITDNFVYAIKTTKIERALLSIRNLIKSSGVEKAFEDAKSKGIISEYKSLLKDDILIGTTWTLKNITAPAHSDLLDEAELKKYTDAALTQYDEIASGFELEVRNDTQVKVQYSSSWPKSALWESYNFVKYFDQSKASEILRKLIEKYPNDLEVKQWQDELKKLSEYSYKNAYTSLTDKGISVLLFLEEIEIPESETKATVIVNGIQQEMTEGASIDVDYYLEKIDETNVLIRKAGATSSETLKISEQRTLNQTKVKLISTKVEKLAKVTVSPYSAGGITTTNFSIHIGIEKEAYN